MSLPDDYVIRQEANVNDIPVTIETFGDDMVMISWWVDDMPIPMEMVLNNATAEALGIALHDWFVK